MYGEFARRHSLPSSAGELADGLTVMAAERGMGLRGGVQVIALLAFLALCPAGPLLAQTGAAIEIVPLTPNASEINALSLTPDGEYLISQGLIGSARDGRARLWQVATGRLLRVFGGNDDDSAPAAGLIALPNGQALAASDTTVDIWDITSGQRIRKFPAPVRDMRREAVSRDGKLLVCGGAGRIAIVEIASGKVVKSFAANKREITSLALSPDGKQILTLDESDLIRVWRADTGRVVRTIKAPVETSEVRFAGDGRFIVTAGWGAKALKLWDLQTGRVVRSFDDSDINKLVVAPDGRRAITASVGRKLRVWDLASGVSKLVGREYQHPREDFVVFPDGRRLAQGSVENEIWIWDLETGENLRTITPPDMVPTAFRVAPDEQQLYWASDKALTVWDLRSVQPVRQFEAAPSDIAALAVTPDGTQLLGATRNAPFFVWDTRSGQIIRTFAAGSETLNGIDFSPDGKTFISHGNVSAVWDFKSGRTIFEIDGGSLAYSAEGRLLVNRNYERQEPSKWEIWRLNGSSPALTVSGPGNLRFLKGDEAFSTIEEDCVGSADKRRLIKWNLAAGRDNHFAIEISCSDRAYFAHDGTHFVLRASWGALALYAADDGHLVQRFDGHGNDISTLEIAPNGRRLISDSTDGVKIWNPGSSAPVATLLAVDAGQWLTISPSGFFTGTRKGSDLASIVRGLEVVSPEQMYQSLFAPDLIRERLAGDPDGEFKNASRVLNLRTVLDSGRVPTVVLVAPAGGTVSNAEVITAQARIADTGGGIGRVEWRVNGVTAAVTNVAPEANAGRVISQALALEPGDNTVEVVAYNARNRLASLPASTTVHWTAPANQPRPKLHVMAVGIDRYGDALFRRLSLAVADAKAFGRAMKTAGEGLYAEVDVTYVLDADATAEKLERVITEVGARMHPRDAFIFFAAAHGKSENGRFHLIPQDYRSAPGRPWTAGTIGQEQLQDWFANRIRARRGVVLLDTCESGALVAGRASGVDAANSEAALGRLNEATGRPVLTAAAADQVALEGYKGHGVFTYALLDALINGDTNNNGQIELSELAAHIQTLAPRLSRELGSGGMRSSRSRGFQPADKRPFAARQSGFGQKPKTGSQGEDFPLVRRLPPTGGVPQQ